MRKKYLARVFAAVLVAGMLLPQSMGKTMFYPEVYAAETDPAEQAGDLLNYTAASLEELTGALEEIQQSENKGTPESPVNIKVEGSFNVDSPIVIPEGTYIHLYGTGKPGTEEANVLTAIQKVIEVEAEGEDGTKTTETKTINPYAVLHVDGNLTLDTLTLDANKQTAVYVSESGEFTMNTYTVLQNGVSGRMSVPDKNGQETTVIRGGGLTNYGTAVMNSGTIQNNTAYASSVGAEVYGGGVYNAGQFMMNGGNILKNTMDSVQKAGGCGGGVANAAGAVFVMDGGKIYTNEASKGGGVYNAGTMTLDGGSIYNNTTSRSLNFDNRSTTEGTYGGGIYNDDEGEIRFLSGTIGKVGSGNSAGQGGGVWTSGTFIMNGADAAISGNTASTILNGRDYNCGGGVYIADGTFTLQDGTIGYNRAFQAAGEENSADADAKVYYYDGIMESGGGVFVSNTGQETGAAFVMEGGSIVGNSAGGSTYDTEGHAGGGVYVQGGKNVSEDKTFNVNPATFTMTGGSITANKALAEGDGVYIGNYDYFICRSNGVGAAKTTQKYQGNALVSYGGSAAVYGNGAEDDADDLFLSSGSRIQIISNLESVDSPVKIAMQDTSEGAVLATYAEGVLHQESDFDRFALMDARVMKYDAETNNVLLEKPSLEDVYEILFAEPEETFTYNGQPQEPEVVLKDKDGNVLNPDAYKLVYKANTDAGTATVTAQATVEGGFTGSLSTKFEIAPKLLSEEYISAAENELIDGTYRVPYTGEAVTIDVLQMIVLNDDERNARLLQGEDYTVSYKNNTDEEYPEQAEWTASVVITGKGNYTGTLEYNFTICKNSDFSDLIFSAVLDAVYTGKAIKPEITVTDPEGNLLRKGTDYTVSYENNTNVGTAQVVVTGIGKYLGEKRIDFQITESPIGNAVVSNIVSQAYTGKEICPAPTVKMGTATLKKGTDYTLSYANNINAGTATVTITGIGGYSGQKTVHFSIVPKQISSASVQKIADKAYTGKEICPAPAAKIGSTLLKKGTDYTLGYSNNKKTGKATVTITGKGNYSGIRTISFNIVPKKATLKSAKSKKKQKLTVTWKKDAQASGYQVMIARNAKFTSSKKTKTVLSGKKTSYTFSKLKKGKRYYVSVRSYKKIDGKKVYGAWSNYRTAAVKKK